MEPGFPRNVESVMPVIHCVTLGKIDIASGNLLYVAGNPKPVLCDNLEGKIGREVGGRFKREGTYVCL